MTGWAGLLVLVLILAGLDVAAWVFGADSRDPCDRDPFLREDPPGSPGLPLRGGRRG